MTNSNLPESSFSESDASSFSLSIKSRFTILIIVILILNCSCLLLCIHVKLPFQTVLVWWRAWSAYVFDIKLPLGQDLIVFQGIYRQPYKSPLQPTLTWFGALPPAFTSMRALHALTLHYMKRLLIHRLHSDSCFIASISSSCSSHLWSAQLLLHDCLLCGIQYAWMCNSASIVTGDSLDQHAFAFAIRPTFFDASSYEWIRQYMKGNSIRRPYIGLLQRDR